jgi:hypothetical protein
MFRKIKSPQTKKQNKTNKQKKTPTNKQTKTKHIKTAALRTY